MTLKIDKMPPEQTGVPAADVTNMLEYLAYLRESINYALQTLQKSMEG